MEKDFLKEGRSFKNPFKLGTQAHETFEILSDLEWHCADCELPGSQPAATIRSLRRKGYDIETASIKSGGRKFCEKCGEKTTHYRMTDVRPVHSPKERSDLPNWLVERIMKIYDKRDAISGRKKHPKELTVDHRIPNIRWKDSEESFERTISEKEIKKKFQLLTNANNLWKSRMCEKCVETGIRQPFIGVKFFYKGSEEYEEEIGCKGCGWYNPKKWKEKLNEFIKRHKRKEK